MLYRRENGGFVDANDSYEVVKVRLIPAAIPSFIIYGTPADHALKSSSTLNLRRTMDLM
jgi:hypothetical protein